MKYLPLLLLLSSVASAQAFIPEGEGAPSVIVPDPAAGDHAGQDVQARSVILSAPSGSAGVTLTSGAYLCLNPGCAKKIYFDGTSVVIGGDINIDSVTTTAMNIRNYLTNGQVGEPLYLLDPEGVRLQCVNTLFGCGNYVAHGTIEVLCSDYSMYACGPDGWQAIASTGNTQLVNGDTDIGPARVVVQAPAGTKGIQFLHNSKLDLGNGANDEVYSDGTVIHGSIWYFSQVGANQLNPTSGDRTTFIGPQGFRLYPLGDGATCDGTEDTGVLSASNTTSRLNYCVGPTREVVAFTQGPWSGILNFGPFTRLECQQMSFPAVGLSESDHLVSQGCASIELSYSDLICSVTHVDETVYVKVCCLDDLLGCGDPSPVPFSALVVR